MTVAGYYGVGAGEVQLGAGYLQPVLGSVSDAAEVGGVLVILRLRMRQDVDYDNDAVSELETLKVTSSGVYKDLCG